MAALRCRGQGWGRGLACAKTVGALAFAVAASIFLFLAGTSPAEAGLTVCNKTSYVLSTAVGFEAKGRRVSKGWYTVEPGQCRPVIDEPLSEKVYFTFGQTQSMHAGGVRAFSGPDAFCTSNGPGEFNIVGQEDCERRGFSRRGFARIETDGSADWTTSFTEAKEYSLEEARIAGVQRLMRDAGIGDGRIDGFLGSKTRRTILDYKRTQGLEPDDTLTPALFQALIADARGAARQTGYRFCNETQYVVWAALGFEQDEEIISTGWFKIAPRKCADAIKDPLAGKTYYSYAEADRPTGGPLVWGGDYTLCTMDNRFTIHGTKDCESRGYLSTGFQRVQTGGQAGYVQTLSSAGARSQRGASADPTVPAPPAQ